MLGQGIAEVGMFLTSLAAEQAGGQVVGAWGLGVQQPVSGMGRGKLREVADACALGRDLQAGLLLPEVPDVPGAAVATDHHPAAEGLDIGGDLYDIFPLSGGRWVFLLGDVCGRGALVAATTALVRHRPGSCSSPTEWSTPSTRPFSTAWTATATAS
ncbi:hypothetical protein [Streptomyces sp. NPDC057403]|uniref:hypothetical protein n=1 Tax=Streptomyces sp. NPDC057403 TaxID=3346119 RepID=UPI0036D03004